MSSAPEGPHLLRPLQKWNHFEERLVDTVKEGIYGLFEGHSKKWQYWILIQGLFYKFPIRKETWILLGSCFQRMMRSPSSIALTLFLELGCMASIDKPSFRESTPCSPGKTVPFILRMCRNSIWLGRGHLSPTFKMMRSVCLPSGLSPFYSATIHDFFSKRNMLPIRGKGGRGW